MNERAQQLRESWERDVNAAMQDAVFERIRWLTQQEQDDMDWPCAAPVLVFSNGVEMVATADDEGNGPGALHTNIKGRLSILPVMSRGCCLES